jgi:hypothetical protein
MGNGLTLLRNLFNDELLLRDISSAATREMLPAIKLEKSYEYRV